MFYNIPVIWLIQTHLLTDSHTPNLEMLSHLKRRPLSNKGLNIFIISTFCILPFSKDQSQSSNLFNPNWADGGMIQPALFLKHPFFHEKIMLEVSSFLTFPINSL